MARTFFPELSETIPASAPHPEGTEYKISIGLEDWGEQKYEPVVKVQMCYDGNVAGRKPPSYPLGTDDFARVRDALDRLMQQRYENVVQEQKQGYAADGED